MSFKWSIHNNLQVVLEHDWTMWGPEDQLVPLAEDRLGDDTRDEDAPKSRWTATVCGPAKSRVRGSQSRSFVANSLGDKERASS